MSYPKHEMITRFIIAAMHVKKNPRKKYSNFIKFKTGKTNSYREKFKTKIITLLHKKQFVKFKVE